MKKLFAILLLSVSVFWGWKNIADAKEAGTISHSDLTLEVVRSDDGWDFTRHRDLLKKSSLCKFYFFKDQKDIHAKTISLKGYVPLRRTKKIQTKNLKVDSDVKGGYSPGFFLPLFCMR